VGELQSTRQRFYYSFGRIGGGVYDGFNTAILSLYLGAFTNNNFLLGYLSNSRTMEGEYRVSPIDRRGGSGRAGCNAIGWSAPLTAYSLTTYVRALPGSWFLAEQSRQQLRFCRG
jgi:hypothetical protein